MSSARSTSLTCKSQCRWEGGHRDPHGNADGSENGEGSGATLYVEVQGSGAVLLCITGGPTDAGMFADLGARLADRYTVVSYDQRGHSRSPLDGEPEDIPVALHADDAAAILAAVGDEQAYVFAWKVRESQAKRTIPGYVSRAERPGGRLRRLMKLGFMV